MATPGVHTWDAANYDLEQVFRAVLYAEERDRHLTVIETDQFSVACSKKYWKASEKLGFKDNGERLKVFPYVLIFQVSLKEDFDLNQQEADTTSIALKETRDLRKKSSPKNEASKKSCKHLRENMEPVDGSVQQTRDKRNVKSKEIGQTDSISGSKRSKSSSGDRELSHCDEGQLVMSPERWLRSKKDSASQSQKTSPKFNSVKSKMFPSKPVRRSPRLCQTTNVKNPQNVGLESEIVSVNKIPNKASHQKKTTNYVKTIPISANSITVAKPKKTKSVSPVKTSIRQTRLQNRNNSSLGSDDVDIAQRMKVIRLSRNDRHLIESEEYAENLKLQSLASSKSLRRSPRKRRSSGLWEFVETITTPIKRLLTGR
ncbi:uncharacterized protein LOC121389679 [Gigantopelta aegis]|uniref:uncharacterized protein LOC121389679 n=1 Tax=Gigantopelta aegis TaxID=1735272 RepID=UPI001B88DC9F|nr:uncharacterized protein LOC121389679 [Gigantopelta aegis]